MTLPLVSVLMPVHNAERYLAAAIGSILSQTFRDFELLVLDDRSTDRSLEIAKGFAEHDQRVQVIARPKQGYVAALIHGASLSASKFLGRMDADDIAQPARFEHQIRFLEENPECVVVGCRAVAIDEDGAELGPIPFHLEHRDIDDALLGRQRGPYRMKMLHPGIMMRRAAFEEVGGYRLEYEPAEDRDLFLRLAEIGRLANLDEALMHYRLHHSNVSTVRLEQQFQSAARAVRDACRRRSIPMAWELPPRARLSVVDSHLLWSGMALQSNNRDAARKHLLAAWRRAPFSRRACRAAAKLYLPGTIFDLVRRLMRRVG